MRMAPVVRRARPTGRPVGRSAGISAALWVQGWTDPGHQRHCHVGSFAHRLAHLLGEPVEQALSLDNAAIYVVADAQVGVLDDVPTTPPQAHMTLPMVSTSRRRTRTRPRGSMWSVLCWPTRSGGATGLADVGAKTWSTRPRAAKWLEPEAGQERRANAEPGAGAHHGCRRRRRAHTWQERQAQTLSGWRWRWWKGVGSPGAQSDGRQRQTAADGRRTGSHADLISSVQEILLRRGRSRVVRTSTLGPRRGSAVSTPFEPDLKRSSSSNGPRFSTPTRIWDKFLRVGSCGRLTRNSNQTAAITQANVDSTAPHATTERKRWIQNCARIVDFD
jgi:hypothetical protein